MEDRAEPPSWLPEGAAPAVADDEAPGQAPAAVDDTSADLDPVLADNDADPDPVAFESDGSFVEEEADAAHDGVDNAPAGAQDDEEPAGEPAFEHTGGSVFQPAGRSAYERPGGSVFERPGAGTGFERSEPADYGTVGAYRYDSGYSAGIVGDGGYNDDMSPSAGEASSASPYSAHYGQPAAVPPAPAPARRPAQGVRRANLVIARLEPWSVMKFSFLMSLVAWVVLFVVVALLYWALSSLGVFTAIGKSLANVTSSQGSTGVNIGKWTSASRILGYTMLVGAVDIIIITALSTVGAMIYNVVTHLGGGIEVTLRETD